MLTGRAGVLALGAAGLTALGCGISSPVYGVAIDGVPMGQPGNSPGFISNVGGYAGRSPTVAGAAGVGGASPAEVAGAGPSELGGATSVDVGGAGGAGGNGAQVDAAAGGATPIADDAGVDDAGTEP